MAHWPWGTAVSIGACFVCSIPPWWTKALCLLFLLYGEQSSTEALASSAECWVSSDGPTGHLVDRQVLRAQPALCALGTRGCRECDRSLARRTFTGTCLFPGSGVAVWGPQQQMPPRREGEPGAGGQGHERVAGRGGRGRLGVGCGFLGPGCPEARRGGGYTQCTGWSLRTGL